MAGEVWINDVDLGDYGFTLGQLGDIATADRPSALASTHKSAPDMADTLVTTIGAVGQIWSGEAVAVSPRKLTVGGYIGGTSQPDFVAKVANLKALVSGGAVRLRFADVPTQEYRDGRMLSFSASARTAILAGAQGDVSFALQFADPCQYDLIPQGIGLGAARAPLPTGTAPSFPVITINGNGAALVNPALTVRNAAGDVTQTLGLTGTIAAGDFLTIDCNRAMLNVSVSGVVSDAMTWWTSGDFLAVRPADGWNETGDSPTLELTASSGTPIGTAYYTRAYL